MKSLKIICAASVLMAGAGCESGRNHASASVAQGTPSATMTYTVELIPNPHQLTPTSREGDKPGAVYSSNIVAVYANTNGINADITNSPASRGARGQ